MAPQSTATVIDVEGRRGQMFPTLTPAQIARVLTAGVEAEFPDGDIVFERGDRAVPFYVVLEGELEILHPSVGFEDVITVHGPGQFTGEASTLADRPAMVRGRARGHLRVAKVEHARFRTLLQTDSDLSELVMRAFILRRMGLLSGAHGDAVVIGSRHSAATLRLREFLVRNGHPYRYLDVEGASEVEQLLGDARVEVRHIPILIHDREVLRNPTDLEVAESLGLNPELEPCSLHDLVVCGAGPSGLAAAVYAASEGLDVLVVETHAPGGQAASSSKIENYLGFPTGLSGQALAGRALAQAEKFGAKILVARGAVQLSCGRGPIAVELAGGQCARARAVVIATGAEYRKLDVPELARFEGVGIYYAATFMEAQQCPDDEVVIVGGGNSAGQAATFLAQSCKRVHMLVRSDGLAATMSRYLIRRIEDTPNITLRTHTKLVAFAGDGHLEQVTWRDEKSGEESTLPIRHVFTMAGARPNTEWLRDCVRTDANGFVITDAELTDAMLAEDGWPLARRPYLFETSRPRIFAVGDVRANNVKRVASAVGEGSVCIQLVHKALLD